MNTVSDQPTLTRAAPPTMPGAAMRTLVAAGMNMVGKDPIAPLPFTGHARFYSGQSSPGIPKTQGKTSTPFLMQESNTPESTIIVDAKRALPHDKIAQRANELWVNYGRPADRDLAIWLEAEQSLLAGAPAPQGAASAPASSLGLPAAAPSRAPQRSTAQASARTVIAASSQAAVKAARGPKNPAARF